MSEAFASYSSAAPFVVTRKGPVAGAFPDLPNREPAAHLLAGLTDAEFPRPTGYNVLVVQYVRPQKVGSLIMPDKVRQEDEFQGCVGYVLAVGPEAYRDTAKFPSGAWVQPGDWVAWPRLKSTSTRFGIKAGTSERVVLAIMPDDAFVAIGVDPERLSV